MRNESRSPRPRLALGLARNRAWAAAAAALLTLACLLAPVAAARHTHRVSGYTHGLGDGANDNAYVHPFISKHDDKLKIINVYRSRTGNDYLRRNYCYCGHVHLNQDTAPYRECLYYMWSSKPYGHYHEHHYYCGA
jgi:hypothetical protein